VITVTLNENQPQRCGHCEFDEVAKILYRYHPAHTDHDIATLADLDSAEAVLSATAARFTAISNPRESTSRAKAR
jgi:hypothetical protein